MPELASQITELAGHLNAGTYRFLTLIAEFDRRKGWNCGKTMSCAHWLNWQCGIDLGAARENVRVAHALESLPLISAAMARGELSYSKVRALTRVASAATEAYLLSIALHGTASHVEKLVRHFRRVLEVAELSREARQDAGRSVASATTTTARSSSTRGFPPKPADSSSRHWMLRSKRCRCRTFPRRNVSGLQTELGATPRRCAGHDRGKLSRARCRIITRRRTPADRRARRREHARAPHGGAL